MSSLLRKAKDRYNQRKQQRLTGSQSTSPDLVDGQSDGSNQLISPPIPPNKPQLSSGITNQYYSGKDQLTICFETYADTCLSNENCSDILISNVTFLGDVHSRTTLVKRDLGFQGQIGQYIFLSYGDTLYSDSGYSDTWRGMTSNSVAFATRDPLMVVDPKLNADRYPEQFVPVNESWGENMAEWAVGITNVIETTPGEGMLYYLLNHRPAPDHKDNLMGAGIARIVLDHSTYPPLPHAQRLGRFWWDGATEPWYGDVGAVKANGYIYSYGHCKDSPFVYLARVRVEDWSNIDCYEYWHGQQLGWTRHRLLKKELGEEQSVFWQVNQGQVIWNKYLRRFIFIYCDNFWDRMVILRHAPAPEGPWSRNIDVYKGQPVSEGGNIYAAVPHPYFDPSGRTLVITFTNLPNCIQAIKITFG